MKKALVITMIMLFAVSMFPLSLYSANPTPSFIVDFQLDRKAEIESMSSGEYFQCVAEYTNDDVKITASVDNANWFLGYYCDFNAEENNFIKLRVKNETLGDTFEVWASTSTSGNYPIRLDLWQCEPNSTQYKEYIFDVSENIGSGAWAGNIKRIRLDFIVGPNPQKDDVIYLDYFAVFKTKADAEAFSIDAWESANPPGNIITDPPPVSDGYPSVLFDFKAKNKEEIEKKVASNPGDCTIEFLEDALLATSTVNNANWRYGLNADVHIALAQYVKFRIKNETASEEFEMWYHPEINNTSMPGSFRMPISTKDTEYKEYIFKMTDYVASGMYVRNLGTLRIDFAEAPRPATGEKFYIDYIAFFATQEEAEHFNIVEYRAGTWKPLTPGTTETTTATGGTTTPPTFDALPVYIMTAIPAAALITFAFRAKRRIYSR